MANNNRRPTPDDPMFTTLPAGARCAHCEHVFRPGEESFNFQSQVFCGIPCLKTHLSVEILGCDRFRQWLPSASGGRALRIPHYTHYLVMSRLRTREEFDAFIPFHVAPTPVVCGYIVGRVQIAPPNGPWRYVWDLEGAYAFLPDPLYWNDAAECPWV